MIDGQRAAASRRRAARLVCLGLALAALLGGCGEDFPGPPTARDVPGQPTTPTATPTSARPSEPSATAEPSAAGLVAAVGELGHERFWKIGADGRWAPLEPSRTGVFGLAASADGRLAVTHPDGRLSISAPVGGAARRLAWRTVTPRLSGTGPAGPVRPLGFAAWSFDAARIAVDWVDFGAGRPYRMLVVDPRDGRARAIDLPFGAVGAAPGWIGDDGLLVIGRDRLDRRRLGLVDLARGRARLTGVALALLAVSPDGRTAAWLDDTRTFVGVGDAAQLTLGRPARATAAILAAAPDATPNELVFDPSGRRLAILWRAGPTPRIVVYEAVAGWRETTRVAVPEGATRVVIAWLR